MAVLTSFSLGLGSGIANAQVLVPSTEVAPQAWGYAYGYDTYYVAQRRSIPQTWGNAREWYSHARADGFLVGARPAPGAIAWTAEGALGHVAYVEGVSGDFVTMSEMNFDGWNRFTFRTVPASLFLYIY